MRRGGIVNLLQVGGKCPITVTGNLIGSFLSTIISILTSVVYDDIVIQVSREIKIYLAKLNIFKKSISALHYNLKIGNKNMYWLENYTFISLLNVTDTIHRDGPSISWWEGLNEGDGYFRCAKPKIIHMHSNVTSLIHILNFSMKYHE